MTEELNQTERAAFEAWQDDYLSKQSAPNTVYDSDEYHFTIWQAGAAIKPEQCNDVVEAAMRDVNHPVFQIINRLEDFIEVENNEKIITQSKEEIEAFKKWLAAIPKDKEAERYKELLQNLVTGLENTVWSSWQSTAEFSKAQQAAEAALEKGN